MKLEKVIGMICAEMERAEALHPSWPRDPVKASALCAGECGELVRACNDYDERRGSKRLMITEAVHAAATAVRFLKNINEEESSNE